MDFWIEPFFIALPYRARVRSALARLFAAPLLCQGGEFAFFQFIHTLTDRACKEIDTAYARIKLPFSSAE